MVVTATAVLSHAPVASRPQAKFLEVLDRNVKSLRRLLDDVTDLARIQAGKERLQLSQVDIAAHLSELAGDLGAMAEQRGLSITFSGPSPFIVSGDIVKIRRIAQNLVLNAIRYTQQGGVTVTWHDSVASDGKRWVLSVKDTGPGFDKGPASPLTAALEAGAQMMHHAEAESYSGDEPSLLADVGKQASTAGSHQEPGEGIGLSIVKRLTQLLDASVEVDSAAGIGTTFRVLFPKHYAE